VAFRPVGSARLLVRVNDDLVLDAGTREMIRGALGREVVVHPPATTLFHQVLTYLHEMPDPPERLPGTFAEREGVAATAVSLRWGSYLAVLVDHDKPVWPETKSPTTSRISDDEMARINIEASAALAEWIDIYRAESGGPGYQQLVDRAVAYLPMPRKTSAASNHMFGALALPTVAEPVIQKALFVPRTDGTVQFAPLPSPTDGDIVGLTEKLARRLGAIARRRLERGESAEPGPDQNMVHAVAAEALRVPLARAERHDDGHVGTEAHKALCARIDGFSLHAARTVAPHDRQGLERLCRYGLRAPFSLDRLSTTSDGRVRLQLLRPWPNPAGRTEIILDPQAFLRRMAALVPAPYQNLVRYHGVFANRSRLRPLLPKPPARIVVSVVPAPAVPNPTPPMGTDATDAPSRPHRMSWAALLKRVLDIDALSCPACGTAMVVLAFLSDPAVVRRILDHLDLPSAAPRISPARGNDVDDWLPLDLGQVHTVTGAHSDDAHLRGLPPRAPP